MIEPVFTDIALRNLSPSLWAYFSLRRPVLVRPWVFQYVGIVHSWRLSGTSSTRSSISPCQSAVDWVYLGATIAKAAFVGKHEYSTKDSETSRKCFWFWSPRSCYPHFGVINYWFQNTGKYKDGTHPYVKQLSRHSKLCCGNNPRGGGGDMQVETKGDTTPRYVEPSGSGWAVLGNCAHAQHRRLEKKSAMSRMWRQQVQVDPFAQPFHLEWDKGKAGGRFQTVQLQCFPWKPSSRKGADLTTMLNRGCTQEMIKTSRIRLHGCIICRHHVSEKDAQSYWDFRTNASRENDIASRRPCQNLGLVATWVRALLCTSNTSWVLVCDTSRAWIKIFELQLWRHEALTFEIIGSWQFWWRCHASQGPMGLPGHCVRMGRNSCRDGIREIASNGFSMLNPDGCLVGRN